MDRVLRVHCFQQVPEEGPGCIKDWVEHQKYEMTYTRFYANEVYPEVDDYDFLIVMGGPMSVYDEESYPWLKDEKRMIREAVLAGKKVLGICLGAQFIAAAMGASVYAGKRKEIGWMSLQMTELGQTVLQIPQGQNVFHWHGDTFDLPEGAQLLASSTVTPHQGFMIGDHVMALQFHLEVTEDSLQAMTNSFAAELIEDDYIQNAETILSGKDQIEVNNKLMFALLDKLVKGEFLT